MFDENTTANLEISPQDVAAQISNGATGIVLIDVREEWELVRGILPGAVHRPLSRFAEFQAAWQQDGPGAIVYCEHGVRSLDVALWLLQNKGIHTRSMRGGFAEWTGPVQDYTPAGETA